MGSILGDGMGAVHPHICERGDRTHFISGTLPPLCFPAFRPPRRGPKIRSARQLKSEFKWGSPSLISTCLPRYSPPVAFYSQCKYVKRRIICMRFDFTPTPKTGSSQKLLHRCEEGSMASGKSIIGVGCHRKPPQSKC